MLSLSAEREEAALAIAAVERLGGLGAGPLPDGFSSGESSLTMLRACFPWGDVGAQLKHGRRAAELEGPGSPWRPLACSGGRHGPVLSGVSLRRPTRGWFAESAALAAGECGQWLAGEASLAYRSWNRQAIGAGLKSSGCWRRRPPDSSGSRRHREGHRRGSAGAREYRSRRAAGPEKAHAADRARRRPLADLWGSPSSWRTRCSARRRCSGPWASTQRAADAMAEARSSLGSCPDPGDPGREAGCPRTGHREVRPVRSGDQELTQQELRVLELPARRSVPSGISAVSCTCRTARSTATSGRSIRKLAACSRAGALERGRQLGLL